MYNQDYSNMPRKDVQIIYSVPQKVISLATALGL